MRCINFPRAHTADFIWYISGQKVGKITQIKQLQKYFADVANAIDSNNENAD